MVSPITSSIRAQRQTAVSPSPLTMCLVVPKLELGAQASDDVTIPLPDNTLTEITSSNASELGTGTRARAMYDYIESGASVRMFVLPYPVTRADTESTRLGNTVTALGRLEVDSELAKLPNRTLDVIVVPDVTGLGAGANSVIAELRRLCADGALGAVAMVDAGPISGGRAVSDVANWVAAGNSGPDILLVGNNADVSGHANMFGSVIVAGHWARYTSLNGVYAQPANLRDTVAGISNLVPLRGFDERDGSSDAVSLARSPSYVSSLITWNGSHYLWGGDMNHPVGDPRVHLGNNILSKRMVKEARRAIAPNLRLQGSARRLDRIRVEVEGVLSSYLPRAIRGFAVANPVLTEGAQAVVSVDFEVQFYDFIDSIALNATVYV